MLGYTKCRAKGTSKNAGDGGVGGLSLFLKSELSDTEKGDPHRSCYHCPILTPNLHPSVFPRYSFFALLGSAVKGLSVRVGRNRGEERQKFVLKCVKVKSQELFSVFLMPALRRKLS